MESRLVALKKDWGEMKMQLADCNTKLKVVLQQMKELNIQIRSLATDPTLQSSSLSVLSGSNSKAVLERAPKVAKDVSEQETHGQKLELPASKEGHELSLLVAANEAVVKTEDDVGIDSLVAKAEEGEKVEEYDKKSGLTAAHLEKRMNDKTRAKLEDNRIFTRVCNWASAEECIDGMVGHKGVIFDPGISMLLKKKWTAWVLPSCIWALIREMTPVSQSIFMAYEFYLAVCFNTTLTASGHESEKDVRWFEENYWVSWDEARLNALILEENSCSGYKCDDLLRSRQRSVLLGDTRLVWHPP